MSIQNDFYNLVMSGNPDAWMGTSWAMEYDRVFEYTIAPVKQKFEPLDDAALEKLIGLPTLFSYEKYLAKSARVGRISQISRLQDRFQFSFAFDLHIAPIAHDVIMHLRQHLDIGEWEVNRSHWAVKNVDLAGVLKRAGLISAATLAPPPPPPQVFISYSWDSPEHQAWVTQLAVALRSNGIDVKLDQWHVRPGEDLANFMARSVRESDRVLVVCTKAYVQKAHQRQGGVGYEQMLVTGQMMRDVGTAKFIPIVRQTTHPYTLPDELSSRRYVDLSEGQNYQQNFHALLRDLHNQQVPLPPLGRPPVF